MASQSAAMTPLTRIRGLRVLPDAMHVGPLCIFLITAGSVLWQLCEESCFGAPLKQAYSEFWTFVRSKGKSCTQQIFTVSRLSMNKKSDRPVLKAKAANAMLVVEWLAEVCDRQAQAQPDNEYAAQRATMLWGLTSVYTIWRQSPMWLTPEARQNSRCPTGCLLRNVHQRALHAG